MASQALEDELAELDRGMKAIRQLAKRLHKTLMAKEDALKAHRRIYTSVANVQKGYYRMVGLDAPSGALLVDADIASRLCKTPRRTELSPGSARR